VNILLVTVFGSIQATAETVAVATTIYAILLATAAASTVLQSFLKSYRSDMDKIEEELKG
jgi:hypothetical protein